MKKTKDEIIKIAKQVMQDVGWTYEESTSGRPLFRRIEDQIEDVSTQKSHPRFQEYVALLFPYWDVFFDFPEDDGWGERNIMWILIKDETGEPYEIGHRQYKGKITKNNNGKYQIEDY